MPPNKLPVMVNCPPAISLRLLRRPTINPVSYGQKTRPPTFHEQRSLSERLYRAQGIDTQKLLGHKSSKMTDRYNDDRGKEWVTISLKSG